MEYSVPSLDRPGLGLIIRFETCPMQRAALQRIAELYDCKQLPEDELEEKVLVTKRQFQKICLN